MLETKSDVRVALKLHGLPPLMLEGIWNYLHHRIAPGGFLSAVVANDFMESAMRADEHNRFRLKEWAQFMFNEFPPNAWGSRLSYERWLRREERG